MTYSFVARRKEVDKKHRNIEKEAIKKENIILRGMIGKKVKIFIEVKGGGCGGYMGYRPAKTNGIIDIVGVLKNIDRNSLKIKPEKCATPNMPLDSYKKEEVQRIVVLSK
ncbi:MAG: hypothetical protein PHG83_02180 [Patescibacteria group bacterium]|nr:hypothetical protein [Patescibacteria group bacterium]